MFLIVRAYLINESDLPFVSIRVVVHNFDGDAM